MMKEKFQNIHLIDFHKIVKIEPKETVAFAFHSTIDGICYTSDQVTQFTQIDSKFLTIGKSIFLSFFFEIGCVRRDFDIPFVEKEKTKNSYFIVETIHLHLM